MTTIEYVKASGWRDKTGPELNAIIHRARGEVVHEIETFEYGSGWKCSCGEKGPKYNGHTYDLHYSYAQHIRLETPDYTGDNDEGAGWAVKLMGEMGKKEFTGKVISLYGDPNDWHKAVLINWRGKDVKAIAPTLPLAVARLYLAAIAAGVIEPGKDSP
jgi:hypothetical protein